jgi:uncharacterized protein with GYD domain
MAEYLATVRFTGQGVAKYKDTVKRAQKLRTALKKIGVEVKQIYWSMGRYDGFLIFSAKDDEVASAAMLSIAATGNVSLTTSRLFDEKEMARIIAM